MAVGRSVILSVVIVTFALRLGAQRAQQEQSLKAEIGRMDSELFAAFNARDLAKLGTFFAPHQELRRN